MMIVDAESLQVKLANRKAREVSEALPWLEDDHLLAQLQRVAELGQPLYAQVLELDSRCARNQAPCAWEYDLVPLAGP